MWLVAAVLSLPVALTSAEAARERARASDVRGVRAATRAGYCGPGRWRHGATSDRTVRDHPVGGGLRASRVTFA
ncbi:MAG: hypothetical protein CMJ44_03580 [Pimelobacter sp.]|nr:hypothetical protein [Pimelobacter sp.]